MSPAIYQSGQRIVGFQRLPFELFTAICLLLPMSSILAFLQVHRSLRLKLTRSDASGFWKIIRTAKSIPSGPPNMTELEWLHFLFPVQPRCEHCKTRYGCIEWDIVRRYCDICIMTCTDECPTDSNGVPRGVETFGAAIPTFSDVQGVARYVHEDLVNLQPSRTPAPLHSRHPQVLQKCRDDLDNLKVYTQAAQRWFNKTSVGRFIAIGINPGHHTVSEMEIGYEILPEQELDSGDWLRFQHHRLIPIRAKFTELFLNDQDPKWHHLRTLVDIAWTTFLRQQSKHMQRIAPHSSVIALLPCFRDVIVLGDRTVLDVEELCTFMGQKLLSINRWNVNMEQAVMVQLVERGRDPALVEFYRLEGETIPPPTTDGSRLRDSAMTEVCCNQCGDSFSSVATAMHHFNRYGGPCIDRFTPRPTMLSLVSSPASVGLVCASGLDPSLTSCHDMDLLWGGYSCLSCDGAFKGNWRECVKHFRSANHHHRNDGEVFDYYGLFTRLDSMVYDLNLPEYDKPLWSCGHCSRFVENPATRDQIIDHVARAHEVHAYEHSIPVDYFYVGP